MASFTDRMLGAARLNVATFEEVEADKSATFQALTVVIAASIALGIGGMAYGGVASIATGIVGAVLGWAIWAGLIWLIGTKLLAEPQTSSDWGEVARTTGFAQAPGLLRVFGFIPVVGWIIMLAVNIWMLVAMVIAVRQALDYKETWRAVVVVAIGWVANLLILYLLAP